MSRSNSDAWIEAEKKVIQGLIDHFSFKIVDCPPNCTPLKRPSLVNVVTGMVYKHTYTKENDITVHKC